MKRSELVNKIEEAKEALSVAKEALAGNQDPTLVPTLETEVSDLVGLLTTLEDQLAAMPEDNKKTKKDANVAKPRNTQIAPEKRKLLGTVINITKRDIRGKDGEMRLDTRIVELEILGETIEESPIAVVFITDAQWQQKGFDCAKSIFLDNVVSIVVEECIADVTGYEDADGNWQTHETTHNAFFQTLNCSTISLMAAMVKMGLPTELVREQVTHISNLRFRNEATLTAERSKGKTAVPAGM